MKSSKWEFIIPTIEAQLNLGVANKTEIARKIKEVYNLPEEEDRLRVVVSRLINSGKVKANSDLKQATSIMGLLENQGTHSKLKTIWKGPTKDSPGFSIEVNPEILPEDLLKETIEDLKKSILEYSPIVPEKKYPKSRQQCCAIINLFDAHIDKLTLEDTTGKSITFEDNVQNFINAFDNLLLSTLPHQPEEFIFPVGSDFFNSNVFSGATKKGTPQSNSVDPATAFKVGIRVYRSCIDKMIMYGKVKVIVIKGNHDEHTDFYLGQCLELIYENNENVEVDDTRKQRKYVKYGNNLFGFAHGDKEKNKVNELPLIMAEEEKQFWADTTYREWYLGDIHHKEEFKFKRGVDYIGCMVRFLRSVSSPDTWHTDQGYVGIPKTGEAFIWSKTNGMKANYLINI